MVVDLRNCICVTIGLEVWCEPHFITYAAKMTSTRVPFSGDLTSKCRCNSGLVFSRSHLDLSQTSNLMLVCFIDASSMPHR